MKVTKERSFKVGDIVYAAKDMRWGTEPMKVVELTVSGCRCEHPGCHSLLLFYDCELEHDNTRRRQLIENVIKTQSDYNEAIVAFYAQGADRGKHGDG